MNTVDEELLDILLSANRAFCIKDYLKCDYDLMLLGHVHGICGKSDSRGFKKINGLPSFCVLNRKNGHIDFL